MHNKIRNLLFVGLFIAMEIILTRFLSVESPIIRISFEFIPIAISAVLFGPVTAGIGAAIADILGMMIFPKGPYFPGFTLSAFLTGFLYGIILYKKKVTVLRTLAAVLLTVITTSLILNTIWLLYLTDNGAYAIFTARLVKSIIFVPIQTTMIYLTWKYTGPILNGAFANKI